MNTQVTHRRSTDYQVMPWKNGAGSTTELAIHPPTATLQAGFDWRISLAQVPNSGPFSSFPAYERTIVLLRGDPMRLVHEGRGEHKLEAYQPYTFAGAWTTSGILTGETVEDFNVMLRVGLGYAKVTVYEAAEQLTAQHQAASQQFLWVWKGHACVSFQDQKYKLQERDSLVLQQGPDLTLHLLTAETVLLAVDIIMNET